MPLKEVRKDLICLAAAGGGQYTGGEYETREDKLLVPAARIEDVLRQTDDMVYVSRRRRWLMTLSVPLIASTSCYEQSEHCHRIWELSCCLELPSSSLARLRVNAM